MRDPFLSLVVPAFDEVDRIGTSVTRVLAYLDARSYASELIVVLDGGRPGAEAEVAAAAAGRPNVRVMDNRRNRGKGFSVRSGMLAARGERLAFIDADLSLPIEGLGALLEALEQADVAIGARSHPGSVVTGEQQRLRRVMGGAFNRLVQTTMLPGLGDTQCGFKGFRREAAKAIFSRQRIDGFGFDVEVLWLARRLGFTIREIPVACAYHGSSSVSRVASSLAMVADLARVRANDALGRYSARDTR